MHVQPRGGTESTPTPPAGIRQKLTGKIRQLLKKAKSASTKNLSSSEKVVKKMEGVPETNIQKTVKQLKENFKGNPPKGPGYAATPLVFIQPGPKQGPVKDKGPGKISDKGREPSLQKKKTKSAIKILGRMGSGLSKLGTVFKPIPVPSTDEPTKTEM